MKISLDSLIGNNGPSYPEAVVAPYRKELTDAGFTPIYSVEAFEQAINRQDDKVVLLVLNSVCGCSARVSRPAAILSLFNGLVPDEMYTVFAGMEKEVVVHLRANYLAGITPSSPNIYLFKNGKLIHIIHRYQIEGSHAGALADELIQKYNEHCTHTNTDAQLASLRQTFIDIYQVDPFENQTNDTVK
mgnify:CR=1 FL=1